MSSPIDISIEAALELEELKEGVRDTAPAFDQLFAFIRTPSPSFEEGQRGLSMLADVRSYAIFRDSIGQVEPAFKAPDFRKFESVIENFMTDLEKGVAAGNPEKIVQAKRFCLALNANLMSRQLGELYARRERSDSRYVSHESTS